MMARITDLYIYVSYKPEEIQQLRNECQKIESLTSDKHALALLSKTT